MNLNGKRENHMSKGSKAKLDYYYNNSCYEVARFGKMIYLNNIKMI